MLSRTKDQPLQIVCSAKWKSDQKLTFNLKPVLAPSGASGEPSYRIGIASNPIKVVKLPFRRRSSARSKTIKRVRSSSSNCCERWLNARFPCARSMAPSESAAPSVKPPAKKGWTPLLLITAAISLNLGIMNLLPIPILDGGVILLLFVESLMQKDISLPIKERIYQAAFVFLVLFAVMVIYNDIIKTLPGLTRMP